MFVVVISRTTYRIVVEFGVLEDIEQLLYGKKISGVYTTRVGRPKIVLV